MYTQYNNDGTCTTCCFTLSTTSVQHFLLLSTKQVVWNTFKSLHKTPVILSNFNQKCGIWWQIFISLTNIKLHANTFGVSQVVIGTARQTEADEHGVNVMVHFCKFLFWTCWKNQPTKLCLHPVMLQWMSISPPSQTETIHLKVLFFRNIN